VAFPYHMTMARSWHVYSIHAFVGRLARKSSISLMVTHSVGEKGVKSVSSEWGGFLPLGPSSCATWSRGWVGVAWALTIRPPRISWFQPGSSLSYTGKGLGRADLGAGRRVQAPSFRPHSLCSSQLCLFPLTATTIVFIVVTPAAGALKLLFWNDSFLMGTRPRNPHT
jgi:hypothetical protein